MAEWNERSSNYVTPIASPRQPFTVGVCHEAGHQAVIRSVSVFFFVLVVKVEWVAVVPEVGVLVEADAAPSSIHQPQLIVQIKHPFLILM
jgi:hypothetical protein